MRPLLPVLALLVAALPMTTIGSAAAAGPTCEGRPATIVGSPSGTVTGTDGADVIVSNGARSVDAGHGDDTICVTASSDTGTLVIAGTGSDSVDTTAAAGDVEAYLSGPASPGAPPAAGDLDTYRGGPGGDFVLLPGDETVDVHTGGGPDYVSNRLPGISGTIDLGAGDDSVETVPSSTGLSIAGGTGINSMTLSRTRTASDPVGGGPNWDLDNRHAAGTASADGTIELRWTDFTDFMPDLYARRIVFRGGPRPERLVIRPSSGSYLAAMGGGDDAVTLRASPYPVLVHGGAGEDTVTAFSDDRTNDYVHLDLSQSKIGFRDDYPSASLVGIEDAHVVDVRENVTVPPVVVRGTAGPNRIDVSGDACVVRVSGRGGNDTIGVSRGMTCARPVRRVLLGGDGDDVITGTTGTDVINGGPGDDELFGRVGNDVLRGGPGLDHATGGSGWDRCSAEVERTCEK